jgi:hypothetical protein
MGDLQLSVISVQNVEFRFELQAQFDFFLVHLCVLHVLFFESQSQLLLLLLFLLELVLVVLHGFDVLLQSFFVFDVLMNLFEVVLRELFQTFLVLPGDLAHHNLIVCLAAIFQQNLKHKPQ